MLEEKKKNKNIRVDAYKKVTAKAEFIEDIDFKGILYAATIRSPISHGRINGIGNIDEIKMMQGVKGVIEAKDIPGENIIPFVKNDYPALADKLVKFHGQPIALVVADTNDHARNAALSSEVEYEEFPAVFDILKAVKPDTVYVGGDDNVHSSYRLRKGNIDKGFKEADVIVEGVYYNKHQVHCYLENQGIIAVPDTLGGLTVYGSMQCPFYVHNALVKVTGLPYNRIRVIQTTTGGGFGGKEDMPSVIAAHAAIIALKTSSPVKLIYDRKEDFISMSKRHPARTRIKYGATRDGKIIACEAEYMVNGGAYCTLSPIVVWRGLIHIAGCYDIPNVSVDTYAIATNTVPSGAFRGFGQPQVNFANEILIDELAEKLEMDPLDLRKINMLKTGGVTATGQTIGESCGFEEVLQKTVRQIRYKKYNSSAAKGHIKKGLGLSTTFYGVGLGAEGKYFAKAGAQVYIKEDGSVLVSVGNVEMGQGAETVFNRICADTIGASYDMVEIMEPDTTRVPDSGPTVASRATMVGGKAVMDASLKLAESLKKAASIMMKVKPFEVEIKGDKYVSGNGEMEYTDVVKIAYQERLIVAAQGWYRVEGVTFDEKTGLGDPYPVYTFSANACEVEVDTDTGQVKVTKFVAAHDIGKAIHKPSAEGQIQGGTAQAIGYALYENLCIENGKIINPSLTGYTIPTSMDLCDVEPIIVESPYADGPYGAKGLGEPPMVGPAPAILNAIYDACGVRMRSTPVLPEDLLKELNKLK